MGCANSIEISKSDGTDMGLCAMIQFLSYNGFRIGARLSDLNGPSAVVAAISSIDGERTTTTTCWNLHGPLVNTGLRR